jgi:hypothetical protein
LGPEGFFQIHQSFVSAVHKIGLLTPPILDLSKMVIDKIILIGDSTFLKAVASTKGQKDTDGNRLFTDDSIASGKPHHKHKYPVGYRAHTLPRKPLRLNDLYLLQRWLSEKRTSCARLENLQTA